MRWRTSTSFAERPGLADTAELIAVVNASPLILLGRIERLDLLRLAGRTIVPQAVIDEVAAKDAGHVLGRELAIRLWLEKAPLAELSPGIPGLSLGKGESAVLHFALELGATAVLDDRRARACAIQPGVAVIGTLGLVVRARRQGLLPAVRPVLDGLASAGMFLSPRTRSDVLRLIGE